MPTTRLYLDTARLGLTSRSAQQAHRDFVRFSGEEGCSLYFDKLLRDGFHAWPSHLQQRFAGLQHWEGIGELKQALRHAAGFSNDENVLIANRSAQLMRLASRLLFRRCRHVLVTDIGWPSYQNILAHEKDHVLDAEIALVPIRSLILYDQATVEDVVERIAFRYRVHDCDGLFLPAVSNDGIRLPIGAILKEIRKIRTPRFVVVDGAQAFCHTPLDPGLKNCDIYLAGCHKWLRACNQPMGLAFCPKRRSQNFIQTACQRMLKSSDLDDPLLIFTSQLESNSLERFSETVNLAPMFSCRAALNDWNDENHSIQSTFRIRLENAQRLAEVASNAGWRSLLPDKPLRCGILLLQAEDRLLRAISAADMRLPLQSHGITATTYHCGIIRLAMPNSPLTDSQIAFLQTSLQTVPTNAITRESPIEAVSNVSHLMSS